MKTYHVQSAMFEMAAKRRVKQQQLAVLVVLLFLLAFAGGYQLFSWTGGTLSGMFSFAVISFVIDYTEKQYNLRVRKERYGTPFAMQR